ncbi:protein tyrosine kinase 7 (inactive) L homeolog precursor [Xenopus laevis]|uniref:Inactive tyrosine-protein kinase 7 n=2 Tax=Xenopus laevis TaxID=8355 RepID=Q6PA07_XENLA|nr:protein tyrosine kinase 7 (inactive) L homeolog precursor [Xenopus laevis]AAH60500.1 MGC68806 protein [Xenopus laevis]
MGPIVLSAFILLVVVSTRAAILFTKEPYSQDALHGRSAILRCEVEEPVEVQFEWLQNGVPVRDTERRYQEGGSLTFTAVDRKQDGGTFQCVARNPNTGEEGRSNIAYFNIKWIESGGVTLQYPGSASDIQSSSRVILRCHIDGHPRPICLWFRDGTPLADDGQAISLSNRERTLTLHSAGPDDSGEYYCCAYNAAGSVCSNRNFTLSIIDESFPQAVVIPEDQVVNKNEDAMFHCLFSATPPPSQEWFFEDQVPLSNKSRITVFQNGSLLISSVRPRSSGVYSCVGTGYRGQKAVLKASLRLADIDKMRPLPPRVLTADMVQRITCDGPQGIPPPTVWWERDGTRVPAEGRVYQDGMELVFKPITEGDSGSYICHAANKAGERRQELQITVATVPEWLERPTDSLMEEGKPGFLHCQSKASLEPNITWYRNGNPVSKDSRFEVFPNGTLKILHVEVYDGTVYRCVSSTPAGYIDAQARVHVQENLKFTPIPRPHQCMELDKEMTVHCSATGREKPNIQWIKGDGSDLPGHVESKAGLLHFQPVTRRDAGNYTCIASNSLQGEIQAAVHLTVAVLVSFKIEPENTTVYQGHTAVLHCQAEGDPTPNIQWQSRDVMVAAKHYPRIQVMPNGSLVIYRVTNEDAGKYACIAGNACDIKHRDTFLYVVDKPPGGANEPDSPYKLIQTIVLSVVAAVTYIIIVLGLMLYCKKRRKARRHGKHEGDEPEMECLNGDALLQNGQTTAEIPEEVPLTTLSNKRHSSGDKISFPRANLHPITTLGRGEFGEVFLAKAPNPDSTSGEAVVLVKALQTRDEQLQMDFRRELDMFSKLNHANVVRLVGQCREAEPHYMVLEYIDLGDLKQFLRISRSREEKPKPLSSKHKVSLCTQVALGMEHLSNSRFVHKDLAARNCLVSAQRLVKVSALGLSKDVYSSEYHPLRQTKVPLRWMSPEAVQDDDFSTKSDVWSFGVLMWEVFTLGELPYTSLPDEEVLAGLQNGSLKLPAPEGCSSRVYRLMQRCWAPSPKDRPSFSEIVNALGDLSSGSKTQG